MLCRIVPSFVVTSAICTPCVDVCYDVRLVMAQYLLLREPADDFLHLFL